MTNEQAIEVLKRMNPQSHSELSQAFDTAIRVMELLPQTIEKAFDDGYESGYDDAQGDGPTHENGRDYYKSLTTKPTP